RELRVAFDRGGWTLDFGLRPYCPLHFLQLLELRFRAVIFIQRITAADHSISWASRTITEGAADRFGRQSALFNRICQDAWIRQHHPPEPDDIRPTIPHDILRDVRQVLLQITITGADQDKVPGRARFDFADDVDLPRDPDQRIFRRLITIRWRI